MLDDLDITLKYVKEFGKKNVRGAPLVRLAFSNKLITSIEDGRDALGKGQRAVALKASANIYHLLEELFPVDEIHPFLRVPDDEHKDGRGHQRATVLATEVLSSAGLHLRTLTLARALSKRERQSDSNHVQDRARKLPVSTTGKPRDAAAVQISSAEKELLTRIMVKQAEGIPFRTIARIIGVPYCKVLELVHRAYPGVVFPRFRLRRIADNLDMPSAQEVSRLKNEEHLSFIAIGRKYGLSTYIVKRIYYSINSRPLIRTARSTRRAARGIGEKELRKKQKLLSQIERLVKEHLSLARIARRLKQPYSRVWRLFHEAHPGAHLKYRRPKRDWARDPRGPKIDRLRKKEKLRFRDIAAIMRISVDLALKIYHARNPGPIPRFPQVKDKRTNHSKVNVHEVIESRERGELFEKIAARYGVSRSTIQRIYYAERPDDLTHRNVKRRVNDLTRPCAPPERVFALLSLGWSVAEIAKELHTCHQIVRKVIKAGLAAGYRLDPMASKKKADIATLPRELSVLGSGEFMGMNNTIAAVPTRLR
jgi:hypothetical protein